MQLCCRITALFLCCLLFGSKWWVGLNGRTIQLCLLKVPRNLKENIVDSIRLDFNAIIGTHCTRRFKPIKFKRRGPPRARIRGSSTFDANLLVWSRMQNNWFNQWSCYGSFVGLYSVTFMARTCRSRPSAGAAWIIDAAPGSQVRGEFPKFGFWIGIVFL